MLQAALPTNGVVIYADTREMQSRVVGALRKQCEVREKRLDVADYLLSDRAACERKSSGDFIQSLVDGRLFSQLAELRRNFEKPLLIIEGENPLDAGSNVHPNAIRGALASIAVDYAIPVIWTKTQLDTARQLFAIAKREQLAEKRIVTIRGNKKRYSESEVQEFIVAGLPKVSTVTARKLLSHFGTPERVFAASEGELTKVRGIGKEMARKIRALMTKKYE